MQDATFATRGREPLLPAFIIASLLELNRRLLDVASAQCPSCAWQPGVPAELGRRVAYLDEAHREALAQAPYALFDLRFADDAHWEQALAAASHPRIADPAGTETRCQKLAQLIVFFAWNLAQARPRSAPLVLGMSERVAGKLAALTLDRLPGLNGLLRGALGLRWPERRSFWFALTSRSCVPGSADFTRAQLFGLQLAASTRLSGSQGAGTPAGRVRRAFLR